MLHTRTIKSEMIKHINRNIINNIDLILSISLASLGIYIFYPGAMSGDSIDQWRQVLNPNQIGNWFPPAMVHFWILLNKISHGPQVMLIFHFMLYFFSIYLFGKCFFNTMIKRSIYIIFVGVFPPIFFLTGVIWKDVSMLVGISSSIALLFLFEKSQQKILLLISLLFFMYGISVRYNAIVCALPYSIYLSSIIYSNRNKYRSYFILPTALMLVLFISQSSSLLNNFRVNKAFKSYNIENAVFFWDLWGMSFEIDKNIVPPYVFNEKSRSLGIDVIKKYYNPHSATILWLPQYLNPNRWTKDFPDRTFKRDFFLAILKYPKAYLKVRSRITLYMLGFGKPIFLPFLFEIQKFPETHYLYNFSKDLSIKNPNALKIASKLAKFIYRHTPLYKVWIYIVLSILQLFMFVIFKNEINNIRQPLLLLSIGLLYWLPYPIFSPSAGFRYSNLTVFCTILVLPLSFKSMYILMHYYFRKNNTH